MVGALVLLGAARLRPIWRPAHQAWERRLLSALPDQVAADPQLVALRDRRRRARCTPSIAPRCHGADMQGNPAVGAPNLADSTWLYGSGTVYDIERTVLYGIRIGAQQDHTTSRTCPRSA